MATTLDDLAGEWPLTGRTDVIERFVAICGDAADAANAASTPPVGLALVGPAGVGKTRLAAVCLDEAAVRGWRTVRVAGSSAASSIPFGAVAPLLAPDGSGETDFAMIISRSHAAMTGGGPLCLVVDDAHLLDDASITLVQHIASTAGVIVVITARSERATPRLVTTLWRDGAIARIDLDGLSRDNHDALIAAALGGPIDEPSAHRLFAATGGNPLFARELLMAAADDNAIFPDGHGGWRLGRPPRSSSRLAELVAGRVGSLDDTERRCLETIAVAEPVGLGVIEAMGFGDIVARLERRRLIETMTTGTHVDLVVSQPLYAEVARDRLRPLRGRNLRRELATALESLATGRQGDAIRIATWRLEAGLPDSSSNLLTAASEAWLAGDVASAERFAAAAHAAEPSPITTLALAQSHFRAGNGSATEAVLDGPTRWPSDTGQRAALTVLRAKNLFWLLGRDDDAMALLNSTLIEAALGEPGTVGPMAAGGADVDSVRRQVRDQIAELRVSAGHDAVADDPAHLRALTLMSQGRLGRALESLRSAAENSLAGLEAFILVEGGWLAGGAALATRIAQAARGSGALADGWAQLALGSAQLADGNGAGALESFRDASATFDRRGDPLPRSLCRARVALAHLLLGDVDQARRALGRAPLMAETRIFGAELDRARAAVAVADDRRGDAVALLRERATLARERTHLATEQLCLHDLIRMSDEDAAETRRVIDLGAIVDSPLASLRARHADCRTDVARLGLLAADVEREGFAVWACELASATVALHAERSSSRAGASEQRRVVRLRAGFPRAMLFTPSAAPAASPARLRPGELQVAELAAQGLSDREISERLHLSVRTVGNYLLRGYRRLGISGRDELAAALADAQRLST